MTPAGCGTRCDPKVQEFGRKGSKRLRGNLAGPGGTWPGPRSDGLRSAGPSVARCPGALGPIPPSPERGLGPPRGSPWGWGWTPGTQHPPDPRGGLWPGRFSGVPGRAGELLPLRHFPIAPECEEFGLENRRRGLCSGWSPPLPRDAAVVLPRGGGMPLGSGGNGKGLRGIALGLCGFVWNGLGLHWDWMGMVWDCVEMHWDCAGIILGSHRNCTGLALGFNGITWDCTGIVWDCGIALGSYGI